jgi:hypothetical protein
MAIYPSYIASVFNPVFPCITISVSDLETLKNKLADVGPYKIDVWSKNSNDELWAIYNEIKATLNLKTPSNGVFYLRQISVNDDLFEEDTQTFHLSSKYKTFCNPL